MSNQTHTRLDLRELITGAVQSIPFSGCELSDEERLSFPGLVRFVSVPTAGGAVRSDAGALSLSGTIEAEMTCICARCAREFPLKKAVPVHALLAVELEDEEDPDYYLLDGQELDLTEVLEDSFIMAMESQLLCRPDCKGLCCRCGADLNDGPCGCKTDTDPRLAVLEQLLDDKT